MVPERSDRFDVGLGISHIADEHLKEDADGDDAWMGRPVLREREIPVDDEVSERPDSSASIGIPTNKLGESMRVAKTLRRFFFPHWPRLTFISYLV